MTAITSRQNATLKHMARLAREKKYRLTTGEMVCEGDKMLYEALESGIQVKNILIREGTPLDSLARGLLARAQQQGAKLFSAQENLFSLASDVITCPWLLFSCCRPVQQSFDFSEQNRILLLDGIQDPGNLGTILRTADAFALDGIVLGEGCTDMTAPKVVRATMGAAFRQSVCQMPLAQAIAYCKANAITVYGAALEQDSVPITTLHFPKRIAMVIGNEGQGISKQVLEQCDKKVIIPMAGRAESLNAGVAAAILIWEMTRKEG